MTFDPHDPEIVALMKQKAWAQTERVVADDERLQREPNRSVARMRAAARAADPTSILGDDEPIPTYVSWDDLISADQMRLAASVSAMQEFNAAMRAFAAAVTTAFSPLVEFAAKLAALAETVKLPPAPPRVSRSDTLNRYLRDRTPDLRRTATDRPRRVVHRGRSRR